MSWMSKLDIKKETKTPQEKKNTKLKNTKYQNVK